MTTLSAYAAHYHGIKVGWWDAYLSYHVTSCYVDIFITFMVGFIRSGWQADWYRKTSQLENKVW